MNENNTRTRPQWLAVARWAAVALLTIAGGTALVWMGATGHVQTVPW